MDFKKGDKAKVLEPYAVKYGMIGTVVAVDVHSLSRKDNITIEFHVKAKEAETYDSTILYAKGIENVIIREIYRPEQLLRIPNTRLGRLLYV